MYIYICICYCAIHGMFTMRAIVNSMPVNQFAELTLHV